METACSRYLLATPIVLPACIMYALDKKKMMPTAKGPLTALQMGLIFA